MPPSQGVLGLSPNRLAVRSVRFFRCLEPASLDPTIKRVLSIKKIKSEFYREKYARIEILDAQDYILL
jgi:hypothetical protein